MNARPAETPLRKVLIVSPHFPPVNAPDMQRTRLALPYLRACGWELSLIHIFAWWGAWLNPDPQKTVIAPDPWFAGKIHDDRDLVPAGWTRIPAA